MGVGDFFDLASRSRPPFFSFSLPFIVLPRCVLYRPAGLVIVVCEYHQPLDILQVFDWFHSPMVVLIRDTVLALGTEKGDL